MRTHSFILRILVPVMGVLCSGCLTMPGENRLSLSERTGRIITIHALATRAEQDTNLERQLRLPNGRELHVRKVPLLTSASIKRIERHIGNDGQAVALAHLSRHGVMNWTQACAAHPGERVIVTVNGVFHHVMSLPPLSQVDETVALAADWTDEELNEIIEWAPKNYRAMNEY